MVAANRQRAIAKILSSVGKSAHKVPEELSVLDHLLIGTLQEGTTFEIAYQAYKSLLATFYDMNELRVSHVREIADQLQGLVDAEIKAKRILQALQFIFETTYGFDLEGMKRKPLKQAHKQLSKVSGATSFSVSATVQRALGGHAIPLDMAMMQVLKNLEAVEEGESLDEVRAALEHLVPKSQGQSFCFYLSELASDKKRIVELAKTSDKGKTKETKPAEKKPAPRAAKAAEKNSPAPRKSPAPKKPQGKQKES